MTSTDFQSGYPHKHDKAEYAAYQYRKPTSGYKFGEVRGKKYAFDYTIGSYKQNNQPTRGTVHTQVETQKQGCHQHGDGDGQSVGCLHV